MSKHPFVNLYKLRLVADTDSKPCSICYKPTTNVLITLKSDTFTKVDFFYVCRSHLDDANFCKVRYITDDIDDHSANKTLELNIQSLQKDQFKLKEKITKLKKSIEDSNSQLTKLVSYFTTAKGKEVKENENAQNKEDSEDDKTKLANLEKELESISKQLIEAQNKNRKYQLDQSFYHSRLKKYFDAERRLQQQQKLMDPSFFPSVSHLPKPGEN